MFLPIWGYQAPASLKLHHGTTAWHDYLAYLGLSSPSLIEAPSGLWFSSHLWAQPIWGYQAPASLKPRPVPKLSKQGWSYLGLSSPSLIEAVASVMSSWMVEDLSGAIKPQPH